MAFKLHVVIRYTVEPSYIKKEIAVIPFLSAPFERLILGTFYNPQRAWLTFAT